MSAAPKPIGLTVNYLRSGRPLDTYAKVSIVKQGRRVVAFEAQAYQDDSGGADRVLLRPFHAAPGALRRAGLARDERVTSPPRWRLRRFITATG